MRALADLEIDKDVSSPTTGHKTRDRRRSVPHQSKPLLPRLEDHQRYRREGIVDVRQKWGAPKRNASLGGASGASQPRYALRYIGCRCFVRLRGLTVPPGPWRFPIRPTSLQELSIQNLVSASLPGRSSGLWINDSAASRHEWHRAGWVGFCVTAGRYRRARRNRNHLCLGAVWKDGVMKRLKTLGGNNVMAWALNDRGEVAESLRAARRIRRVRPRYRLRSFATKRWCGIRRERFRN